MKESKSNTILNQYLRVSRFYCYYEVKVAKGGTFNFSKIETNQDEGLPALAKAGLVWKFSDEDSRKKPCDGGCFPPLPAFLAIKFKHIFYLVEHSKIAELRESGRKSIKESECRELSTKIINIGS